MTLGARLLWFRRKFGHGLRTAYFRDVVRSRIRHKAPVVDTTDRGCEIHALTSAQDWLNLLWTLHSFYAVSPKKYALCIHGDGTLAPAHVVTLSRHFPAARIIAKSEADAAVLKTLSAYPRSLEFRKHNALAPKVFDFVHFLRSKRMLLLDSDVLFFATPTELLRRIEDSNYRKNTVNGDTASAYTVNPAAARECAGVHLIERFNSGLGLIHRDSLRLDWFEEFLAIPGILGHFWRIEQTLFALSSSRFGVELLPHEYGVRLTGGVNGSPCRHYVGAIRHLFYSEGIRRLKHLGINAA